MATKNAADNSKKQIYMVAGLGVVLAVILVIQVPRLMGGGSEAAPTSTSDSLPTSGTPTFESGSLGNVSFVPGIAPKPAEGQLASFSRFTRHDPFVQLVKDADATTGSQDGEPVGVQVKGGGGAAGGAAGGAPGVAGAPGLPSTSDSGSTGGLSVATIWVNGTDETVDVKDKFPKADPTFVLLSLKPKVAQIGVAGGGFTGGQTISLKMGKPLTLVNTTTGARYTLKLLYSGSGPEQVQQFTTQASN